ncbi:hypothetical protein BKE30_10940 [Alkanindiges hydrocarboniclasticus]|uniref:Uncharacterized protein n=1 Tax=Alkanindiges hydrocarboniclasticus TaxID=1907941 RepID=A0A1S8CTX0_9GAMM|nr:hypothetical protein BKE30_10940 [Alkanindiges hydrocarboniclasticus]
MAEDISQGFKGYNGLIDSNFDHVNVWENSKLKTPFPELFNMEYEQNPRGRILYSSKQNKHIIYMDKNLFKSEIKQKISEFFNINLNQVIWKKDSHYNTNQDELNRLFND